MARDLMKLAGYTIGAFVVTKILSDTTQKQSQQDAVTLYDDAAKKILDLKVDAAAPQDPYADPQQQILDELQRQLVDQQQYLQVEASRKMQELSTTAQTYADNMRSLAPPPQTVFITPMAPTSAPTISTISSAATNVKPSCISSSAGFKACTAV